MRILTNIVFFLLLLSAGTPLFAQVDRDRNIVPQNNDREEQRIAIQYYQNREFEKALSMFTELYERDPNQTNYTYYLYSLTELREFDEAEKLAKKHSKKNPDKLRYRVDLGYVYLLAAETEKAQKIFDEVIKRLPPKVYEIKEVASAFYMRNQTEYAISTYERGKELMKGEYSFDIELAGMYERNGNFEEMVETYLSHLAENPEALQDVENRLQNALAKDIEGILPGILREILLVHYQDDPDEIYLNELLLWLSVQQKDFSFAFTQAKSLDRRFHEDGYRVLDVANLALSNKDYDAAITSYQYILDKGSESPLYLNGLIGFLETRYQQISNNIKIEDKEMILLEAAYLEALDEFGVNPRTIQLLRDLAHIQAFHLNKEDEAIENLNEAIEIPGPESLARAQCKIELADIYLFRNEIWEATLLYSQVEKTFKNEPIGHLAKLKNARLTYYIGEFAWAKAQLDVLKAATSKLIANDALELSLLIADNIEADSSYRGLRLYSIAELLLYRNKYDDALATLDSLNLIIGWHPLRDEALYKKAEIRIKQGLYEKADTLLEQLTITYPDDILGDDALFLRAQLQKEIFLDEEKSMELFKELLLKYPGSIYTIEARKQFRDLRGDHESEISPEEKFFFNIE